MTTAISAVSNARFDNPAALLAQAPAKPSLSDIQRNYQVAEDRMANWEPKLGGLIPLGVFTGSRRITATEGAMLDGLTRSRGILGLQAFQGIVNEAQTVSAARVPPASVDSMPARVAADINKLPAGIRDQVRNGWPLSDGHTDAFRHAYWNARMTQQFGSDWAKQYATAHEAVDGTVNNSAVREAMDLYNNEVGRAIATANPNASPAEIADKVKAALDRGELVVVNQSGTLSWSNEVAVGQHGRGQSSNAPGVLPIPAGDAYVRGG
jgi:hypothetical protein